MEPTLTNVLFVLNEWKHDMKYDIESNSIEQHEKAKMMMNMILLNNAIASLKAIYEHKDSQTFKSCIKY
jgi:hypothetical protein